MVRRRGVVVMGAVALASGFACQPAADDPDDDTGGASSTGEAEDLRPPVFLNPVVGPVVISANKTDPQVFVVHNVSPGVTQVLLDNHPVALSPNGVWADLSDTTLTLYLHGALTVGIHSLQMVTPHTDGVLASATLQLTVERASSASFPSWRAELEPEAIATGSQLFAAGSGQHSLVGVVQLDDPAPALALLRLGPDAMTWDDEVIEVPLVGHVPEPFSNVPAISAVIVPTTTRDPQRLRIAYTVAAPEPAVHTRDLQLAGEPQMFAPEPVVQLSAALGRDLPEWSALGRPWLLGHSLLVELHAVANTEQPLPGDRRLITSFWRGEGNGWTAPQQVSTTVPTDLDALGLATLLPEIALNRGSSVAVRVDGVFPGILDVHDTGAVTLVLPQKKAAISGVGPVSLATVVSTMGSQTAGVLTNDGSFQLLLLDGNHGNAAISAVPMPAVPERPPTGAMAVGVGRGFPLFLVPYGSDEPVHVVFGTGETCIAEPISELYCDNIAVAATLAGNDPAVAALPLVCLLDGLVYRGELVVEAP